MGKLEAMLARMGYVKLDRYGLYLTPEGRIVTTAPRVLDDGSGGCVVGWKSTDPVESVLQPWQGKSASPAGPQASPPPAVALAKLALAEAGKSTRPTMPPPPVPARSASPTRPPPVVVIPPIAPAAPVETAPEPEDDEDEWEWQMAMARARAAAEEAERAAATGPTPPPAPTTQITPAQPVPKPAATWVKPDSTPVPRKAAEIPRVARPQPAPSPAMSTRPPDPMAPVVRSQPLPGVHAARLAAAKTTTPARLPHAPPADRPVSDDTVRTTAIGEDTVRTTAVAERAVGDTTTQTKAAPPPPVAGSRPAVTSSVPASGPKKVDRQSSAPVPEPAPLPPAPVRSTVIPVPDLPVANAGQRTFEPVVRSRVEPVIRAGAIAASLPESPRSRLARGTDRVDQDRTSETEITHVGPAPSPLPRITTRLARR